MCWNQDSSLENRSADKYWDILAEMRVYDQSRYSCTVLPFVFSASRKAIRMVIWIWHWKNTGNSLFHLCSVEDWNQIWPRKKGVQNDFWLNHWRGFCVAVILKLFSNNWRSLMILLFCVGKCSNTENLHIHAGMHYRTYHAGLLCYY